MITALCPKCAAPESIADEQVCKPCTQCKTLVFRPTSGPLIAVAYENDEARKTIGESLWAAGFNVLAVPGADLIGVITRHPPVAMALDVGLTGPTSHEVISFVKADPNLQKAKLVLVASVYNKAAYKRRPSKLYGADDYVEQHHIDTLPRKMAALLHMPAGGVAATPAVPSPAASAAPAASGTPAAPGTPAAGPKSDFSARLRVRALAQSIVADIVLYHNTEVEQAVLTGTVENLRGALDEGRRLLAEMAPMQYADQPDPVGAAFMTFLHDLRRVEK